VQDLINHNPNLSCPDFNVIKDKIDGLFITLLNKIRNEHSKFRYWIKTYGYSLEVMKFIKNVSEYNFESLTGSYL
jgi:hypothetical protein